MKLNKAEIQFENKTVQIEPLPKLKGCIVSVNHEEYCRLYSNEREERYEVAYNVMVLCFGTTMHRGKPQPNFTNSECGEFVDFLENWF